MPEKILKYLQSNIIYICCTNLLKHEVLEFAGYLTYLNILSIFPFIFILFTFVSFIDETEYGLKFINYLLNYVPDYFHQTLGSQIIDISKGPSKNLLNIAVIGAIWTASSSIEALKSIFNRIYLVHEGKNYIIGRMTSIGQFLIFVFMIIVVIFLFIIIPKLMNFMPDLFHFQILEGEFNLTLLNIFLCLIVALIYYSLTNARMKFISTIPGAIITVIIWNITSQALSYYMQNFQVSIMYGSLAGIIITLMFLYSLNLALMFGAELNRLLSLRLKQH